MARGKQASRSSIAARNKRNLRKLSASSAPKDEQRSEEVVRASIEYHYSSFCPSLQPFITHDPQDVTVHALIKFWSRPENSTYAGMDIGPGTCHMLAYEYLNLGENIIAHALIRCGAFLNQVNRGKVSMTAMAAMSNEDLANAKKLPVYMYAVNAINEGREMFYLRKALPLRFMKTLGFEASSSK